MSYQGYHPTSLFKRLQENLQKNALQESEAEGDHAFTGRCMEMCPRKERNEREMQRRLHILEIVKGTEKTKRPIADASLIIKEYSRPAAGKAEASLNDLRPPHILLKTVHHLMNNILTRADYPWSRIYSFTFDRLRAVRQDLVIQRASGSNCLLILEQCVRFHLYAAYRLCSAPLSEFDPKINSDHASECLKRLLVLYKLQEEQRSQEQEEARAQMEACYIIFNIGSIDALLQAVSLPEHIRTSPSVCSAVALSKAYMEGNFIRIRKLASRLGVMELCCLHAHLRHIQRQAVCVLNTAFSSKNLRFPISDVARWLMVDDVRQAEDLCRHYGLQVGDGKVHFQKSAFNEDQKLPPKTAWCTFVECELAMVTIPALIQGRVR